MGQNKDRRVILIAYRSKKMHLKRQNWRERKDLFRFFGPYRKLKTRNLPVVKEQEISYLKKKKQMLTVCPVASEIPVKWGVNSCYLVVIL